MPVGNPTKPLPRHTPVEAPAVETIERRELDGVLCDANGPHGSRVGSQWRGCPQWAYVQVRYMDDDKIVIGDVHLCGHHYAVNQIAIELAVSLGRAGIMVDEREHILDGLERKDVSA